MPFVYVTDKTGQDVPHALFFERKNGKFDYVGEANEDGLFNAKSNTTYRVEMLGFKPQTFTTGTGTTTVELDEQTYQTSEVTVTEYRSKNGLFLLLLILILSQIK